MMSVPWLAVVTYWEAILAHLGFQYDKDIAPIMHHEILGHDKTGNVLLNDNGDVLSISWNFNLAFPK